MLRDLQLHLSPQAELRQYPVAYGALAHDALASRQCVACDAGNSIMCKSAICNWALSLDALNVMAARVSCEPLFH